MIKVFGLFALGLFLLPACSPEKIEPILPPPPPLSDECELFSYTLNSELNHSLSIDYSEAPVEDTISFLFPHFTDLSNLD